MKCRFEVGQRIAAIGETWLRFDSSNPVPRGLPRADEICLIVEIFPRHGLVWLVLSEFPGAFLSTRFRPLVEPDISVFTSLLEPLNKRERAREPA